MSYVWNLPTKVLFGPGMVHELEKQELPGKKALLVTSCGSSAKRNGSLDIVENALKSAGAKVVLFNKVQSNPVEEMVAEGVRLCRSEECDFVVGLGGGSVLDTTTLIASIAPQKGDRVWDYVQGGTGGSKPMTERMLPYIEITTTAGTGSEVDNIGVVINSETHEKIGFKGGYAELAIVDPELMLTVPPAFTAYQGFDTLFHCVEGFISSKCNEAAEMFELEGVRNVARYLPVAVKDGSNLEARTKIAFANVLGGYSMCVCSNVSQHAMEHAMSGYHPELPHGAGLIMISLAYFTKWIEAHVCDDRFIILAKAMGREDATDPMEFVDALRALQLACGVSELKMSDYGIVPDEFLTLAKDARTSMTRLFVCDRPDFTDDDIVEIFSNSYR